MIEQTISLLESDYAVSRADIDKAQSFQSKQGGRLEKILVNMGGLSEDALPELYAKLFNLPQYDKALIDDADELPTLAKSQLDFFRGLSSIPFAVEGDNWKFLTLYPLDIQLNEWIENSGIHAEFFIGRESDLSELTMRYGANGSSDITLESELSSDEEAKLKELASEAPTVNLLNSLITRALARGASDMHLEPFENRFRCRYRIDGVLHEVETIPQRLWLPIVTRLKILSSMDIAEKRRPQDGKIELRIANKELDIRVSVLPLNDSESVVMRFLLKESVRYDMGVLGLSDDVQSYILEDLTKTSGVVLLTGPTGSGKTTSLYTFLNHLNSDDVKIITLEDPVEYQLAGVNQVQVNSDIDFTFAAGLRSIVRQDPDIIMVGEIRDNETARIALQSALTGHLVFSTVHTNDAPSAYTRLIDLGVEPFLLNAALVSIVAQRLARRLCPECSVPHPEADALSAEYNLPDLAKRFGIEQMQIKKAVGCEACAHSGFKGRLAITEYLRCDEHISALDKGETFLQEAREYNRERGLRTLSEDGFYKALHGLTTVEEVIRVAG